MAQAIGVQRLPPAQPLVVCPATAARLARVRVLTIFSCSLIVVIAAACGKNREDGPGEETGDGDLGGATSTGGQGDGDTGGAEPDGAGGRRGGTGGASVDGTGGEALGGLGGELQATGGNDSSSGGQSSEDEWITVGGYVFDLYTDAEVGDALVVADGIAPYTSTLTAANGSYSWELPKDQFYVPLVSRNQYHLTRNLWQSVPDESQVYLHAVSRADMTRNYAGVGVTPSSGKCVVIANVVDELGDPLEGVPLSDITLAVGEDSVGEGPYAFGPSGDIVPPAEIDVTTEYNNVVLIAFLNSPVGASELSLVEQGTTTSWPITCDADGVTLIRLDRD